MFFLVFASILHFIFFRSTMVLCEKVSCGLQKLICSCSMLFFSYSHLVMQDQMANAELCNFIYILDYTVVPELILLLSVLSAQLNPFMFQHLQLGASGRQCSACTSMTKV